MDWKSRECYVSLVFKGSIIAHIMKLKTHCESIIDEVDRSIDLKKIFLSSF